ncbi:response regulator [Limisalsivibrio acetivorans]|uniref:response regulator n=1 Tax=Limisalsivibrio acetivorans TaxID=1304888 RepID=UPI0003B2F5A6|nr:response regulator [Limisalsivibrio acetivorans]
MKKVVFVDDSRSIIAVLELTVKDLVSKGQLQAKSFLNPAEFLQKAQNGEVDFDLLFVDINMPQMTGLELISRLKQDSRFRQKPILVLTTETSADMKSKGKALGVTGWITKPFQDQIILKAIKKILGV